MNLPSIQFKKCSKCGGEWDQEAFFRKRNNPNSKLSALGLIDYHPVCIGCELSDRNDPTPDERARRKVANTIAHHAEKYEMKPTAFAKQYGWDSERMVYDILHTYENTCGYCWEKYASMGHGLDDITVDVVDPKQSPYYLTNVRLCCQTCNREKASLPPELWSRRLIVWPQYMKHREAIKQDPTHGLPLFQDPRFLSLMALFAVILTAAII